MGTAGRSGGNGRDRVANGFPAPTYLRSVGAGLEAIGQSAGPSTAYEGLGIGTGWTWEEHGPKNGPGIGQGSRGPRVQRKITQLSTWTNDFFDYGTDEDNGNAGVPVMSGLRHEYEDSIWSQEFFTYDPKPREFTGSLGLRTFFAGIPTILQLFELF
jgi:hypothetical protein